METEANTSGQGAAAVVPEEIKGWNWGAFLLTPFWSIGNRTWIGLLALVNINGGPTWELRGQGSETLIRFALSTSLIVMIVLGMKGTEWARGNRRWESVDHFRKVQAIWLKWGLGLLVIRVLIVAWALLFMQDMKHPYVIYHFQYYAPLDYIMRRHVRF